MNETDYNARLYEKMKAEQDKYRDWLVRQEPCEILNHTYEYTMREDIVMCMEELELEPEKARALLRSPCPLSDVYKEFRDRETEHMDTIRDSIETEADKSLQRQEKKQHRETAALKSKPPFQMGVSNGCCTTAFFLLPSSGSYLFILRLAILCVRTYLADLYVLLHAL